MRQATLRPKLHLWRAPKCCPEVQLVLHSLSMQAPWLQHTATKTASSQCNLQSLAAEVLGKMGNQRDRSGQVCSGWQEGSDVCLCLPQSKARSSANTQGGLNQRIALAHTLATRLAHVPIAIGQDRGLKGTHQGVAVRSTWERSYCMGRRGQAGSEGGSHILLYIFDPSAGHAQVQGVVHITQRGEPLVEHTRRPGPITKKQAGAQTSP